jgi:hypothetical protein
MGNVYSEIETIKKGKPGLCHLLLFFINFFLGNQALVSMISSIFSASTGKSPAMNGFFQIKDFSVLGCFSRNSGSTF